LETKIASQLHVSKCIGCDKSAFDGIKTLMRKRREDMKR
jgi:hypothetical protein